ncbi:MAG: hypothetical protein HY902_14620 [Deltaproteobacteria bacterium]|nr:hypothetical protein [Deltaproteobacteria bacterium]
MLSSLVLASCANTSSGGGGTTSTADTATNTGNDTGSTTGNDTGSTTKTDTGSQAGTEKSIVDIQKASAACKPGADGKEPASFGDVAGITIRNAVVTTPAKKQTSDGGLVGIYVQQKNGGQWSGIYVIGKKDSEIDQVAPGDVITITGDVKDYYCFTEVNNKFAVIESQGQEMPMPITVTTDDIGDIAGKDKTEPYESVLVQLHDVVVGDDALGSDGKPHGDQYIGKTADDKALRMGSTFFGVYLSDKKPDGTYAPKYPKGTKLGTVTGVLEYSFGAFRLVISKDPEGVVKP